MGLDMYLYRISNPHLDDSVVHDMGELDLTIPESEIGQKMYVDLKPYCQKLRIRVRYFDIEKLRHDLGLDDSAHIWRFSGAGISLRDKTHQDVPVSSQEVDEKYTLAEVETRYCTAMEEVRYWRKDYDMQEWFYEHISKPVENCGYYLLDEETILKFNRKDPDRPLEDQAGSGLFYHEWY